MRRTLINKNNRISEGNHLISNSPLYTILALLAKDRNDLTKFERTKFIEDIRQEVTSYWLTDEIRRKKPTPEEEALSGMAIIETVLWNTVPKFLRLVDRSLKKMGETRSLPPNFSNIHFASWMGKFHICIIDVYAI